jgi:hypothetical protein
VLTLTEVENAGCELCVLTLAGVEKACWDVNVLLFKQEQAEETRASVEPVHCVAYEGSPSVHVAGDFMKLEQNAWALPRTKCLETTIGVATMSNWMRRSCGCLNASLV